VKETSMDWLETAETTAEVCQCALYSPYLSVTTIRIILLLVFAAAMYGFVNEWDAHVKRGEQGRHGGAGQAV
jgi:hypothetical protein